MLKQGAIVVGMADEGGFEEEEIITVTKLKLKSGEHIYVKIRWLQDESLHITALNGLLAWSYHMSVQDVAEIASAWGISVGEFMEMAALHLCLQDPAATYSFRALDFNWTWALVCISKTSSQQFLQHFFFLAMSCCCPLFLAHTDMDIGSDHIIHCPPPLCF
jgi:hypothetical protein